jgi:hypothetical protein
MSENSDLQFERAQFDGAAPHPGCKVCSTPLYSSYFEVNGETVCESCCYKLREATPTGSRVGRVLRATAAGAGAGLGGAILYWGILAATGYEFALIAIVVGFAVGKAVHWGSRGRGGWAYQTLAIGLTYLAIVSAYVPLIMTEIMKPTPAAQAQTAPQDGLTASAADNETAPQNSLTTAAASNATATEAAPADAKPAGLSSFLFALGVLLLIACAAPFLSGVQNVIGIVIIGIGMYEAWKLNRRLPLLITGPHALARGPRRDDRFVTAR